MKIYIIINFDLIVVKDMINSIKYLKSLKQIVKIFIFF